MKWKFSTFCCLSGTTIYQKQKKNNRPTWSQKPSPKQWTRMEFLCWLFVGVCTWSSRCNFFQKMSKKLQVLDQVHFKKRLDQPTFVICLSHWKPRNLLRPPQLWARWSDPLDFKKMRAWFENGMKMTPIFTINWLDQVETFFRKWLDPVVVIFFEMHLIKHL